jgi:hypothetical protein
MKEKTGYNNRGVSRVGVTKDGRIIDLGAKCEKCETINTITLEEG